VNILLKVIVQRITAVLFDKSENNEMSKYCQQPLLFCIYV